MIGDCGWFVVDNRIDIAVVRRFPDSVAPLIRDKRYHTDGLTDILNNQGWTRLPEHKRGVFTYIPFLPAVPEELSSPDMKWVLFCTGSLGNLAVAYHISIKPETGLLEMLSYDMETLFTQNDWQVSARYMNRWGMLWLLTEPENPHLFMKELRKAER